MKDELNRVHEVYKQTQVLQAPEKPATLETLQQLSNNWKDKDIPDLQRKVVEVVLENMSKGVIDPVVASLDRLLKRIPLQSFTFLDAACATGYYHEFIRRLDSRRIEYRGCDYSESMILAALSCYPEVEFEVQDLTDLKYPDRSFDVVMLSGVLEHIPQWQKALSEVCRIAGQYVIHHRCPLTPGQNHEYTIGTQYTIETPRTYFSKELLIEDYRASGFALVKETDVYNPRSTTDSVKSLAKKILRRPEEKARSVGSFLLKRTS